MSKVTLLFDFKIFHESTNLWVLLSCDPILFLFLFIHSILFVCFPPLYLLYYSVLQITSVTNSCDLHHLEVSLATLRQGSWLYLHHFQGFGASSALK